MLGHGQILLGAMPGMGELILIFGVAVLLFGGKKLPELGSALGESIKNFKKGIGDDDKKPPTLASQETQGQFPAAAQPVNTTAAPPPVPVANPADPTKPT